MRRVLDTFSFFADRFNNRRTVRSLPISLQTIALWELSGGGHELPPALLQAGARRNSLSHRGLLSSHVPAMGELYALRRWGASLHRR